ncbi:MAG: transposase [Nitrososphaerota archaeon]|jgi:hypothetical protein|nr:transposase [Nitrososphaerota archaeon]
MQGSDLQALSPADESEETLLVSVKKLLATMAHLEKEISELRKRNEELVAQNTLLREASRDQQGGPRLPPAFVKPNTKKDTDRPAGKPGARKGHVAHHRPPPSEEVERKEEGDLTLPQCACGEAFGDPFDWEDRIIEDVVPGHMRRSHFRVAHYKCPKCGKLTAAQVPREAAPPKAHFGWGVHFLVGAWHAMGFTVGKILMLLETDYHLKMSRGSVDKALTRATTLFTPALEAIQKAVREGKQVVVDNTSWRVDGQNFFLWDFISPEGKAALFEVNKSGGHKVPEKVLPGNRKQTVVCDGGSCFNQLKGKKRIQRDWVHIRRHAKEGLQGYETISDAPDWRWLQTMKNAADAILKVAKLPLGKERQRKAGEARRRVERLLKREVEGEPARKLKKYLLGRGEELWTWIKFGVLAQSNPAEQGIRFHVAGKRKVSGGSRSEEGARRTAALSSVHATARMRLTSFREVGERILRGDPAPFPEGAGPDSPQVR